MSLEHFCGEFSGQAIAGGLELGKKDMGHCRNVMLSGVF